MFAYFSKKWQFYKKKTFFFTTTQKTLFFWVFFEIFFFHFFHVFSFSFSNIKKTKTKSAHFFSKTLFLTPWQTAKKYFRTPTHYLCFLRYPKNTIKLGKNKQKKILDHILTQPWTTFWLKKPQILDHILTLQHIYIYIQDLSGPNRAMQPRCAMRCESRTAKSLAMRKSFFR